jgi:hypothetical protein
LRHHLGGAFVHGHQSLQEGFLAEAIFDEDFIAQREVQLFFDYSFRVRTALAASFKSLPALYYLKRIFETFSEEEGDPADVQAQSAAAKLQENVQKILASGLPSEASWQILYQRMLAHSYDTSTRGDAGGNTSEIKLIIDKLLSMEVPPRYRKDLLKRAFSITDDQTYIEQGLRLGFKEFYMHQATRAASLGEAFYWFEKGIIEGEIPEAFFEAGKGILRHHYFVPKASGLWEKMGLDLPIDEDAAKERSNVLGEALLRQAITLNVESALILFIDLCGNQLEKALAACDLVKDKPWALYQKAKIKEKQFKLGEALETYKAAGPLLGYLDAARLAPADEEPLLLGVLKGYKERILKELYENFHGKYL